MSWLSKIETLEKAARTKRYDQEAVFKEVEAQILALGFTHGMDGQVCPKDVFSRARLFFTRPVGLVIHLLDGSEIPLVTSEQVGRLRDPDALAEALYRGWTLELLPGEYTLLPVDGEPCELVVDEDGDWEFPFQDLRSGVLDV